MIEELKIDKNYISRLGRFYFAPVWQSILTLLYLLSFVYFAFFYIGNVWLALKFLWYTVIHSGSLLGLSYLLWGVAFLITLIVPFSVSLYSLLLLYEIWRKDWKKRDKILGTVILIILAPLIIFAMDEIIRIVVSQGTLSAFVFENGLNISGK